ncbi:LIM/homeobox protein Awh, partial [Fragariocoptes setiger]
AESAKEMEERENQLIQDMNSSNIASEQQSSALSMLNIILNNNSNNNSHAATKSSKTTVTTNLHERASDDCDGHQQSWSQSSLTTIERGPLEVCYGCRRSLVNAKIIMNVDGHHKYHVDCLKCHKCKQSLAEAASCFVLDDEIYCKIDYSKSLSTRITPIKCAKCTRPISSSDWVRRASSLIYHLACFACDKCNRQLSTGEQFTLELASTDDLTSKSNSKSMMDNKVKLMCKLHFSPAIALAANGGYLSNNNYNNNKSSSSTNNWSADDSVESSATINAINQRISGVHSDMASSDQQHQHDDSNSMATVNESDEGCKSASSMDHSHATTRLSRSAFGHSSSSSTTAAVTATTTQRARSHHHNNLCPDARSTSPSSCGESKSKRVRTTFTEEQLQVLQANFQVDSNPDGQDLERIATLTGLSKRVTQVWFQNSRARQKKYMTKTITIPSSGQQHFAASSSSVSSHASSSSPINTMLSLDSNNNAGPRMTHSWSPHSSSPDTADV